MAQLILEDAFVSVDGNDISSSVKSVTVNYSAEMQDDTTMGDDTKSNKGGLKNWSAEVELLQDFATGQLDSILFPLVGTTVPVIFRPTSAAVGPSNPNYTGNGTIESYPPLGGTVGDLASTTISIQPAGTLSRATS